MAPDAVTRSPDVPVPAEDPRAPVAAEQDFVAAAVLDERLRERRLPGRRADVSGEAPEDRAVAGACALDLEGPGMGGLMAQRVFALRRRKVGGNGDAVGLTVDDLSSGQLPVGEPHASGAEPETRGQAIVEKLEKLSLVRGLIREESAHPIRLTVTGGKRAMAKRTIGILAALLGIAASCLAANPGGKSISYPSGTETVTGYLVLPEGGGRKPAIVVIQEWWGLNDFIRGKADEFAGKGYVALAVDLYRGKVATDPDTAHQLMRGLPEDRAIRDLKAAFDYLRSRDDVDAIRIGSVGWCMGGGYSLALGLAEPKLAGAVINYGRLVTDDGVIKGLAVPLLGNFGGQDKGIPPESVREFEAKAKAAGKKVDFKIYPDAGHGFASSKDPAVYRSADAKDADGRTDAFFEKTLKRKP